MNSSGNPGPLDRLFEQARADEPDPPPWLVARVMRRIHDTQAGMSRWRRWRRASAATNLLAATGVDTTNSRIVAENRRFAATGDMIMKKIVWGVAAVAAVAIVGAVWIGYPPAGPGTEATIGAAQRHQAPPAGDKSAALGDMTVQAFLQTDTFDQLMKNPDSRAVLQKAATDPEFGQALANPELHSALADAAVARILADPNAKKAFMDAAAVQALSDPAVRKAVIDAAALKSLSDPAAKKAVAQASASGPLADAAAKKAVANAALNRALADPGVARLVADAKFRRVLADPAVARFFADAKLSRTLADPAVARLLADATLSRAVAHPVMSKAFAHAAFSKVLADSAALKKAMVRY